jgi:hypothetical protein
VVEKMPEITFIKQGCANGDIRVLDWGENNDRKLWTSNQKEVMQCTWQWTVMIMGNKKPENLVTS